MSLLETIAVLLGITNIALIIRRSVWNYPFGIMMVALYAIIFWQAKLYSESGLQIFFALVQIYGWREWMNQRNTDGEIFVVRLPRVRLIFLILISLLMIVGWGHFMDINSDAAYPYWDGSITMLSIVAQILLIWRYLENWWWWIIVDVISIPLYIAKDLYMTSALYGLFLILAISGLVQWQRKCLSR